MEFHQLRYFIAAAEELNMSRAAKLVHVSQPALSKQIALLEEELEVLLFDRIRKRIHLTEAGHFFLGKARQLICDAELSAQQLRERFGGESRTVRLGFISPFLDDLVAPAVREFEQRHPHARVSLFDLPPTAQIQGLKQHEIDVAIMANLSDADREAFRVIELSSHRIAAVVSTDHPLADKTSVTLTELAKDPWVSLSNSFFPGRREFLIGVCQQAGFTPDITREADSLPLMLAEISTGHGVGLMPQHAAKIPHAGCVFISLSVPKITTQLLLVTHKHSGDVALKTFIELIKERSNELRED